MELNNKVWQNLDTSYSNNILLILEQQLGGGHAADAIANVDISLGHGFCENERVEKSVGRYVILGELLASCT